MQAKDLKGLIKECILSKESYPERKESEVEVETVGTDMLIHNSVANQHIVSKI